MSTNTEPALQASRHFWAQSDATRAQRFYVSFCLLVAAVQDTFLGRYEHQRSNLNWSATCSYYGLVHAGRLFTFLALGDYPTQHNGLRLLLSNGTPVGKRIERNKMFVFDWLGKFTKSTAQTDPHNRPLGHPAMNYRQCLDAMVDYYSTIGVSEARERLLRFGKVLELAALLRNDSNYEALLIAHEYRHVTMTDGFDELAEALCGAGREMLDLLCDAFHCFMSQDPELLPDRSAYQSFLQDYLRNRVQEAISKKIDRKQMLTDELQQVTERLCPAVSVSCDYARLEHNVSIHMFGGKVRLMDEFQGRLRGLREALGGDYAS